MATTGPTLQSARLVAALLVAATLTPLTGAATSESLPSLECESLAHQKVTLPAAAAGRVALLVIGFTRGSREAAAEWARRLRRDLGLDRADRVDRSMALFQLAVLEDVPSLLRGMVAAGIRRTLPKEEHDRFLLVLRGEAELKRLVSFAAPDDAYLVLLDRSGGVRLRKHGAAPRGSAPGASLSELVTLIRQLESGLRLSLPPR